MTEPIFFSVPRGAYDILRKALEQGRSTDDGFGRAGSHVLRPVRPEGLIGYVGLEGDGSDRLVRSLVVLPSRRGSGHGSTLLQRLEAILPKEVKRLHLLTARPSRSFDGSAMSSQPGSTHRRASPPPNNLPLSVQRAPPISSSPWIKPDAPSRLPDPDLLPHLDPRFAHERPAFGLGVITRPPRILLLYDSLRERPFSRFAVEEAARLLQCFGAETRILDPSTLPLPDQVAGDDHPVVHELLEHGHP